MSNKVKLKKALAEAVVQALWARGLISKEERQKIDEISKQKLAKNDC